MSGFNEIVPEILARPSALASNWLPRPLWAQVEAAMQGPGRHYHNLDHLDAMIRTARRLRIDRDAQWRELVAAILFHDLIYEPTRTDNEERSADAARALLAEVDVNVDAIAIAILATKRHRPDARDRLSATLSDLDMAILSSDRYREDYAVLIRKEYGHVPLATYAAARGDFLRSCLASKIYAYPAPPCFSEDQARANIEAEIAGLQDDPEAYLR